MKKLLFTLSTILALSVSAQDMLVPDNLNVAEQEMNLHHQTRNGFKTTISGDNKDALKQFSTYLAKTYDLKTRSKSGMLTGEELMNASISQKQFKLYAYIQSTEKGKELRLFINFSEEDFVNSKEHSTEATQAKNILKNFAKEYFQAYTDKEIKNLTKDVSKLDKNLSKVNKTIAKEQKAKSKSESKISKLQAKIKKTEAKIIKSQESITSMENTTIEQKAEIEKIDANNKKLNKDKEEAIIKLNEETITLESLKAKLIKIAAY